MRGNYLVSARSYCVRQSLSCAILWAAGELASLRPHGRSEVRLLHRCPADELRGRMPDVSGFRLGDLLAQACQVRSIQPGARFLPWRPGGGYLACCESGSGFHLCRPLRDCGPGSRLGDAFARRRSARQQGAERCPDADTEKETDRRDPVDDLARPRGRRTKRIGFSLESIPLARLLFSDSGRLAFGVESRDSPTRSAILDSATGFDK